jgi:hypothetical protein
MAPIRVTLRWIKILDNLEPFFKETREFRFRAKLVKDCRMRLSSLRRDIIRSPTSQGRITSR